MRASRPTTSPARCAAMSARAQFTDDPLETFGGAGVVEIPQMQKLLHYICEQGFEHHVAANLSHGRGGRVRGRHALSWLGHVLARVGLERKHLMAIVAGVDFGTLSVRVSIVDSERGLLASAVPNIRCTASATIRNTPRNRTTTTCARWRWPRVRRATQARRPGDQVEAIALDTTGSSVIPVDANMEPLDEYYLWCDHRAKGEAAEITEAARREACSRSNGAAECIPRSGDFRNCCTGCATTPRSEAICVGLRALRHGCRYA